MTSRERFPAALEFRAPDCAENSARMRDPRGRLRRSVFALLLSLVALSARGGDAGLERKVRDAMARKDPASIRRVALALYGELGDQAGVPETAERGTPIPASVAWLSPSEVRKGLPDWVSGLESRGGWKPGLDPFRLAHALREPAAFLSGYVAICRDIGGDADRVLKQARAAADFLLWAQDQGGRDVFPFPAAQKTSSDKAFAASDRILKAAEAAGRLKDVVRNGWIVDDLGTGGLQYDNGECGVALLDLYALTREKKDLEGAKKAAEWALRQPLVINWNYNSFSVYLLARMFRETGEKKYLQGATEKALCGVLPGQLTEGAHAGRWGDPHNARAAYHYILLRGLAELASVLPATDPARRPVMDGLRLGLRTRNRDLLETGAVSVDNALETLLLVHVYFADDPIFLRDTRTSEALDALGKLASEIYRQKKGIISPKSMGLFLHTVVSAPHPGSG